MPIEQSLLEKRLYEAFDVFDNARNGEVDVRDLGTIIRSLGNIHIITILKILYVSFVEHTQFKFFYII